MAESNTEVLPATEGPVQHIKGEPIYPVVQEGPAPPGEKAYRYCLKASTFTGQEDVKQFIHEFSDVLAITQWPPRVALIQLLLALTEKAKPYRLGPSVDAILAALRARLASPP